jgi:DNA-binding beta-propeller fold protein YncE
MMRMNAFVAMAWTALGICGPAGAAPLMIVGDDEKLTWDAQGKPILAPPGRDAMLFVDLADPFNPRIAATLALKNSVVGPPVNLALDPTGSVALVADSVDVVNDGGTLKQVPDDKIYVIDLKADPPKLVNTLSGPKQPSGLSIGPAGDVALVANRAGKSISVLALNGTDVKLVDTVSAGDEVSHVVFTPDGKRALATKFAAHKLALFDLDGKKLSPPKLELPAGLWPYNVVVAPDGRIALTADNGGAGSSDGSVDTVSVIDLEAEPPRVIDKVVVGDGPEGLAISPKGDLAVVALLAGSNNKSAYYYHRNGSITVLGIEGKTVTRLASLEVGGLPEALAFTPDGGALLVGNYLDQDFSIFRVDHQHVVDTGKRLKVPGHPASARIGRQ